MAELRFEVTADKTVMARIYYQGGFDAVARLLTSPRFNKPQREVMLDEARRMRGELEKLGVKFEASPEDELNELHERARDHYMTRARSALDAAAALSVPPQSPSSGPTAEQIEAGARALYAEMHSLVDEQEYEPFDEAAPRARSEASLLAHAVLEAAARVFVSPLETDGDELPELPDAASSAVGEIAKAAARAAFTANLTTIDGEDYLYGALFAAIHREITTGRYVIRTLEHATRPADLTDEWHGQETLIVRRPAPPHVGLTALREELRLAEERATLMPRDNYERGTVDGLRKAIDRLSASRGAEGEEDGASLIAAERRRQITEEGFTAEHDEQHSSRVLAQAGLYYLGRAEWPWGATRPSRGDDRADLIKAGALIAAAIDRLEGR